MRRHKHNLSHTRLMTGDMGLLYPIGVVEVLPGDTFRHATFAALRMSPLLAPVMHPISVRIHHFFVPHRIVWDGWEKFITGGPDGKDASTIPTIVGDGTRKTVSEYMGVPPQSGARFSALPIRGYNAIYNEYYRDQDLVTEVTPEVNTVHRIAWEKDVFTTSRPWPQKGDEVTLPIAGTAPVKGLGVTTKDWPNSNVAAYESDGTQEVYPGAKTSVGTQDNNAILVRSEGPTNDAFPNVYADLSKASAVSINTVRRAFALQRFAEARARYGSRYTEYLRYMGVIAEDQRLDRPEYLGGGKVQVMTSEVLQTANEPTPTRFGVGDLYGHGVAAVRSNAYQKFFREHGYVHTLLSVRPKTIYVNGCPRHWLRRDREEFYQKELEFIGQQETWLGEVYWDNNAYDTFGYSDRFREYREQPSQVSGDFRDDLAYWHVARSFDQAPALNQSFTDCNPSKRIFSVQNKDALWVQVRHRLAARRIVARSAYGRII